MCQCLASKLARQLARGRPSRKLAWISNRDASMRFYAMESEVDIQKNSIQRHIRAEQQSLPYGQQWFARACLPSIGTLLEWLQLIDFEYGESA